MGAFGAPVSDVGGTVLIGSSAGIAISNIAS
jgi:hypothetical protein